MAIMMTDVCLFSEFFLGVGVGEVEQGGGKDGGHIDVTYECLSVAISKAELKRFSKTQNQNR